MTTHAALGGAMCAVSCGEKWLKLLHCPALDLKSDAVVGTPPLAAAARLSAAVETAAAGTVGAGTVGMTEGTDLGELGSGRTAAERRVHAQGKA